MKTALIFVSGLVSGLIVKHFTRNKETTIVFDAEQIVSDAFDKAVKKADTSNRWAR